MTAVLTEPGAAKAAAMAPGGEMTFFSFPVTKTEEAEDGTLKLWGRATDGSLDSDLQIVDPEWSEKALREWYETGGNVRVQHQAQRDPAGKGFEVRGHDIGVSVVEPVAVRLVKAGVLQDFSVGIMNPDVRRGDPKLKHLDPQGKAVNGIITGRPDGMSKIGEVSLVDRGSNYGTRFSVVKAAADGTPQYIGELTASDDVLARVAEPAKGKTVTVELPKNMSLSVKPTDLAKLATFGQKLARDEAAVKTAVAVTKAARPDDDEDADGDDPDLTAAKAAEAGVYKRDIDTATRRRLAGEGRALSDLSYPIETHEDAGNAVTLALSGHGNAGAAKNLIRRVAGKEGWTDILDRLKGAGKKGGKKKTSKAAEPQVTKCGMCGGSGMAEGKPCPECKKGRKKARKGEKAAARQALAIVAEPGTQKKKSKVMCPNCGAKQNVKHAHCPECGKPLPSSAPPVVKNHDFACLGCGCDLDKGEPHCPQCGKENPGYNPMADHKIPANADKAAGSEADKGRVTKRKKSQVKGGKKRDKKKDGDGSFGGKKALPFGKDAEDGKDGKDGKPPKTEKRRKGKKSKPTPGDSVPGEHIIPAPAHREPDGPAIERFEDDGGLQEGDEHAEMAAAMRHKTLAGKGLSRDDALLHDLTCPAFTTAALAKAFPYDSLATVNTDAWQAKALDAAATAELSQAGQAMALWQHACTLKGADPELAHDLRAEAHQAFRKANKGALKAFRDAAPGPDSFPSPGHITPQQFQRPYLNEGHAAPSPQHDAPRSFGVPEGQPSAQDYTRGLITAGHAADSPQNDTPRHEPQPAPMTPGQPDRVYYRGTMRDNARQAMTAMHDHIARVFPDVCPMSPELGATQKPAPQVPEGVGGPAPRRSAKAQKAAARKKAKAMARKQRKLQKRIMAGKISVSKARKRLGMKPLPAPAEPALDTAAVKAAGGLPDQAEVIKTVVTEANAPLLERIAAQDKALRKQRKALDAIASQPDTSRAPLRGAAINKASAPPAGTLSVAKSAEQAQAAQLQMLHREWRTNSDPAQREAAYRALTTQLGINPVATQT